MNQEPVKICSSCGAEYSPEAVTCADCGGKLVHPQEYEKRFVPLESDEAGVLVRQGQIIYLRELSQLLENSGIRSAIHFHGCPPGT